MRINREQCRLYAVTDRSCIKNGLSLYEAVELALKSGITMLQLREKTLPEEAFLEEAKQIQYLCRRFRVPLIINDNVRLAQALDADGVHLGQNDMVCYKARAILGQDKIIGVTAKTVDQAMAAVRNGADYIGSGAVFGSVTKLDAVPLSRGRLREITEKASIPVVAIGGIQAENAASLRGVGIAGIAVASGLFGEEDIYATGRRLRSLSEAL